MVIGSGSVVPITLCIGTNRARDFACITIGLDDPAVAAADRARAGAALARLRAGR